MEYCQAQEMRNASTHATQQDSKYEHPVKYLSYTLCIEISETVNLNVKLFSILTHQCHLRTGKGVQSNGK